MVRLVAAVAILVMLWAQGALAQAVESPLQRAMEGTPTASRRGCWTWWRASAGLTG
jgi:hypothetical protein